MFYPLTHTLWGGGSWVWWWVQRGRDGSWPGAEGWAWRGRNLSASLSCASPTSSSLLTPERA